HGCVPCACTAPGFPGTLGTEDKGLRRRGGHKRSDRRVTEMAARKVAGNDQRTRQPGKCPQSSQGSAAPGRGRSAAARPRRRPAEDGKALAAACRSPAAAPAAHEVAAQAAAELGRPSLAIAGPTRQRRTSASVWTPTPTPTRAPTPTPRYGDRGWRRQGPRTRPEGRAAREDDEGALDRC